MDTGGGIPVASWTFNKHRMDEGDVMHSAFSIFFFSGRSGRLPWTCLSVRYSTCHHSEVMAVQMPIVEYIRKHLFGLEYL